MTTVQTTVKVLTSSEVAEMVGREHKNVMQDIRNVIKQLDKSRINWSNYFIESEYTNTRNKKYPMFLLTKQGCKAYSRRLAGGVHIKMVQLINETFSEDENLEVFMPERGETRFLKRLKMVLQPLSLELVEQKYVCNKYRIDAVIESLNLAIEYDERNHCYQVDEDNERQKEIEDKCGFTFIRLDGDNDDDYNIGLVLKEVMGALGCKTV